MSIQEQANNKIRVISLPQFAQGGRWRTEAMRSYSFATLIWFTRGQGRITLAGTTRGFGAHNAVFLPAGTMHGFELFGQVFGSIVNFPRDNTFNLPSEALHLRFREAQQQVELTNLIENIQREGENDSPGHIRALNSHGMLLSVWLERQLDPENEQNLHPDASRRLSAAYSALVERDYKSGNSVVYYAGELGVTPTHLTRVCNTTLGKSASALIADRVFFEARQMLIETKTPIKTIAGDLGFASAAYFTRAFQKATGSTPSSFRKQA